MAIVVLKILLAPALIAGVSLAGRRWGQVVSGWLVGLPLTAGPIVLFLGLQYGPAFAARAAAGTLMATLSEILFCYAYIRLAARGTVLALSGGAILFVGSAFILEYLAIPLPFGILAVVAALSWATRLVLPDIHSSMEVTRVQPPVWDIPARMITVAALVLALTAAAPFSAQDWQVYWLLFLYLPRH